MLQERGSANFCPVSIESAAVEAELIESMLETVPPVVYKALCRGGEGFETAWNQKTLYTCDRLESNAVVTKIAKVVTNQVSCVLGMD